MGRAAFLQRSVVAVSPTCAVTVEQRTYAHRSRLSLLVTDFTLNASAACPAGTTLKVIGGAGASPWAAGRQDFVWKDFGGKSPDVVFAGTTLKAEKMGRLVSAAFATRAPTAGGSAELAVIPMERVIHSFPTAYITASTQAFSRCL